MAKKIATDTINSLADELINIVNTKFKGEILDPASYLSSDYTASNIKNWVSTGDDILDLAISNRPNGGLPVGRIIEISGLEASGKSLLSAHILAETQKVGGVAVFIDTEAATNKDFFACTGLDLNKTIYIELRTIEDIFEATERIIDKVRNNNKNILTTIVIDSIMGATTKPESEGSYSKEGYGTSKAALLSQAMRKITGLIADNNILLILTNQLREKIGAPAFSDPWTTAGGKAIPFHASVRLRLKNMGQIKLKVNNVDQVIGMKTRATIQKNRVGPPLKNVDYDIYFDSGLDSHGSWLNILKLFGLANSGSYWELKLSYESPHTKQKVIFDDDIINPETGELKKSENKLSIRSKDFGSYLIANPKLKQFFYDAICDFYIMDYKINEHYSMEETILDEKVIDENA